MFIITAPPTADTAFDGTYLGLSNRRALYYSKSIGKGRIYRRSYPESDPSFVLFEYATPAAAQALCDQINTAYNDDFKVEEI